MTEHVIGRGEDFPENRGVEVEIEGINIAVFKINGEYYGIQNTCTHKQLPLHPIGEKINHSEELFSEYNEQERQILSETKGKIDSDQLKVFCPWHNLDWSLKTGECEVRNERIATYEVESNDQGEVVIRL